MYYKIKDGKLIEAPKNFKVPGKGLIVNFNMDPKTMLENGYKPLLDRVPNYNPEFELIELDGYIEQSNVIIPNYIVIKKISLDEFKDRKINQSKQNLNEYIKNHPMISDCHNGIKKSYTVTVDKQTQFINKFAIWSFNNFNSDFQWNAKDEVMEPWKKDECLKFMEQMNSYINSLVKKQQIMEKLIRDAQNYEDVVNVDINF